MLFSKSPPKNSIIEEIFNKATIAIKRITLVTINHLDFTFLLKLSLVKYQNFYS